MSESAKNTLSLWGTLALIIGVLYVSYSQINADDKDRELERARYLHKVHNINYKAIQAKPAYRIYPLAPHLIKYKKRKRMYEMLLEEDDELSK